MRTIVTSGDDAAPVPHAVNQLINHRPDTGRRLYGGVAPSQEPKLGERRGNDGGSAGCGDARRVDGCV
jgi:hypothetical protein